jgi:hypothetical protein
MSATFEQRRRAGQIHERVGRLVIRVQVLESALKLLVPFIDAQDAPHVLHGLPERGRKVSKQTLGQLMGSLQQNVEFSDPASFEAMTKRVVEDRNNLVHHFHSTLGPLLATDEGHEEVVNTLDRQFESVRALEQIAHGLMAGILRALRDSSPLNSDSYKDFASICDQFEAAIGWGTENV